MAKRAKRLTRKQKEELIRQYNKGCLPSYIRLDGLKVIMPSGERFEIPQQFVV